MRLSPEDVKAADEFEEYAADIIKADRTKRANLEVVMGKKPVDGIRSMRVATTTMLNPTPE